MRTLKLFVYLIAMLTLAGCLFAPSAGQQEEVASPPVTITGKPLINPALVSLEGSEDNFEVVGKEGALSGPDRCIDIYVLTRAEFDRFSGKRSLPNRVTRVSVPAEDSRWRSPFRRLPESVSVVLVPASCEAEQYSSDQLDAAVFMELEAGAQAMPFAGSFTLNVARRGDSEAGRYYVSVRDAVGKTDTRLTCHLSTGRTACLPYIWSDLKVPVVVAIRPQDENLSVSDCDFSTADEYYREGKGCGAKTSEAINGVYLSMWSAGNRIDLKLLRNGVSEATRYAVQTEERELLSCHLSTGRQICEEAVRIAGTVPYSTTLSSARGMPMHTCLLRRGEGRATLRDGKCFLEIETPYLELIVGTEPAATP